MLQLKVMRENPTWVLVDKPAGFHTHAPEDKNLRISPRWNALAILERQLGIELFPMHRLDRATSGLLLFSKNRQFNRQIQEQFAARIVKKFYFGLVRGSFHGDVKLDQDLKSERGEALKADTRISSIYTFSLPITHPKTGNARTFTFVRAEPISGRFHQIRRHLAGAGFPLIGDTRHGDRKLNREFATVTNCSHLFLRCMSLEFRCPETTQMELVQARWSREWHKIFEIAGACPLTASPFPRQP